MAGAPLSHPFSQRLQGKVAIITGGASGIGAGTARLFAKHGAKVIIADVQPELGRSVVEEINSSNSSNPATFVHCDVSNESDVQSAVDGAVSSYGKLDIMYSNAAVAGNPQNFKITSLDSSDLNRVMAINMNGAFYCAKHAARVMITNQSKKGTILFTSSRATESFGIAGNPYTASKAAVVGLMRNLAVELGEYGIRVNAVSPGGIATPMAVTAFGGTEEDTAAIQKMLDAKAALKTVVLGVDDIAEAVLFLVSDEAKFVTGVDLSVDGGFSWKAA